MEQKSCVSFSYSFAVLNKTYPNIDLGTKIAQIRWKLSKIYYFKVDHSKFYFYGYIKCKIWDVPQPQQPIARQQWESTEIHQLFRYKTHLMVHLMSADANDAKMLLDIPFPIN